MSSRASKKAAQRAALQAPRGLFTLAPQPAYVGAPEAVWERLPWLWVEGFIPDDGTYTTDRPIAVYLSRDYQVMVREPDAFLWHLSIRRKDRAPIDLDRWRTLQRIKNTLVGPENEAVELYPAESRLVDTANQFHLFVLKDPRARFPFGYKTRLVTADPPGDAVQRPFDKET